MATLRCSWDGAWFFVSGSGRTLAVFPDQLRPGYFCIGENVGVREYVVVPDGDGFENQRAAVDHASWMVDERPPCFARSAA